MGFINIYDMFINIYDMFINIYDMFINIYDMYNNDVGKGGVYAYEAYEVK